MRHVQSTPAIVVLLLAGVLATHEGDSQTRGPDASVMRLREQPRGFPTDQTVAWWPSRVCVAASPGGATVTVSQSCSCGESLACSARFDRDVLALEVHAIPGTYGSCSDCYPASPVTCTARGDLRAVRRVTIHGALAIEVGATSNGCWESR